MGKRMLASALAYSPEEPAPALIASGRDRKAEQIVAVAERAGITVVENTALASLLDAWADDSNIGPGDFIPPWCWEAAAKILAFVAKAKG
ncbi:MAG: EscU/YscU/HrcU family type III secretion system export apparatus switch protein [Treponema sp.]|nr:EscU/YscU/HrcU family type III secretion system export apparatus switch protein [Treponema sp.]